MLGRPSAASAVAPVLRGFGDAAHAAYRADGGDLSWCALRAATVAGVRHRLAGETSEDAFAWESAGDRVAVAVCDGLGSVPGSAAAAGRAAAAAVSAAIVDPGAAVGAARTGVRAANEAAAGGGATTVVVAVIDRDGRAGLARVGDSTAFAVGAGASRARELFAAPAEEGLVGTGTAALPSDRPDAETAEMTLAPGSVLLLVSDGVADPWRDGPGTVAPAFEELLAAPPGPLELARLADFSRQGCHDDRTLLGVWVAHRGAPARNDTGAPGHPGAFG